MSNISFFKYHFMGNDYVIVEEENLESKLEKNSISFICDRRIGIGADGLILSLKSNKNHVKFYNSDGSSCGRSGNGLSIYAQWLKDQGLIESNNISISCGSGISNVEILDDNSISVDMGIINYDLDKIGIMDNTLDSLNYTIETSVGSLSACSLFIGNPHTVIFTDVDLNDQKKVASEIKNNKIFRNGTNVQFIKTINNNEISIDIWERVAGYTPSSGSSACAAAIAVLKRNLCNGGNILVNMVGGSIFVLISDSRVWQRGLVTYSFTGVLFI